MAESKNYITSDDLKTHNKTGDLWISIQGKVYDVSEWSKIHPGGEMPLLNLAGQDATDAFVAFHPGTTWQYLHNFFNGFHLKDYSVSETSKDYRKLVYEFSKMGLFEKKGHLTFITMCVIVFLLAVSVYGVIFCEGVLLHLFCGGLMGIIWIQCGWIGHDCGHYQVMSTCKMNRFAQVLSTNCLQGVSIMVRRRGAIAAVAAVAERERQALVHWSRVERLRLQRGRSGEKSAAIAATER